MRRIPQFADRAWVIVLAAQLAGGTLVAQGPVAPKHSSTRGVTMLAAATPTDMTAPNDSSTNAARRNIPAPNRSRVRTKARVLAAGALIAITLLIVACGMALLSSFKKR